MCCLFCGGQERNYRLESNVEFICGTCVQLLLNADQADLKRAYAKAREKGYSNKAKSIKSFLEKGGNNEPGGSISKNHKRHFDRTRINRPVRHKKERLRRNQAKTKAAVL